MHLVSELKKHFGDAWISVYEPFLGELMGYPEDRHVLTGAVGCGAPKSSSHTKGVTFLKKR